MPFVNPDQQIPSVPINQDNQENPQSHGNENKPVEPPKPKPEQKVKEEKKKDGWVGNHDMTGMPPDVPEGMTIEDQSIYIPQQ